jgi:hypothetical protein
VASIELVSGMSASVSGSTGVQRLPSGSTRSDSAARDGDEPGGQPLGLLEAPRCSNARIQVVWTTSATSGSASRLAAAHSADQAGIPLREPVPRRRLAAADARDDLGGG